LIILLFVVTLGYILQHDPLRHAANPFGLTSSDGMRLLEPISTNANNIF
jgi:hypothetical protein